MFCPKCGNEIKEETKFCPKCGSELVNIQGNNQQNSNQYQNSQKNHNTKKTTKMSKQTIGLIAGIALVCVGVLFCGYMPAFGIIIAGVGAIIMFYTKGN